MVLVDTSVWIDHLRKNVPALQELLHEGAVAIHPFVLGELACGRLKDRAIVLGHLKALPAATMASEDEVLKLLDERRLWGRGIGWIDAHLITSALLSHSVLWTHDEKLGLVAAEVRAARST